MESDIIFVISFMFLGKNRILDYEDEELAKPRYEMIKSFERCSDVTLTYVPAELAPWKHTTFNDIFNEL